jgi:hypothetical protein
MMFHLKDAAVFPRIPLPFGENVLLPLPVEEKMM